MSRKGIALNNGRLTNQLKFINAKSTEPAKSVYLTYFSRKAMASKELSSVFTMLLDSTLKL